MPCVKLLAAFGLALVPVTALTAQAVSGAKTQAAAQAGALLFREKGCPYCHGEGGIGTQKAPDLTGLYKDKDWTSDKIIHQILNGGQKMPSFGDSVTDQEAAQLAAYLRSSHKPILPPAPPAAAPAQ
jgi:mono/diheme cytochrome c family protein